MPPALLDAERPVVLFVNGLGDHLLCLPALRALAHLFEGRMRLVCREGFGELLFGDLPVAGFVEEPFAGDREAIAHPFDARALAERISDCDLLLSLNPWHSEDLDQLLRFLGDVDSIGFNGAFRRPLRVDEKRGRPRAASWTASPAR